VVTISKQLLVNVLASEPAKLAGSDAQIRWFSTDIVRFTNLLTYLLTRL